LKVKITELPPVITEITEIAHAKGFEEVDVGNVYKLIESTHLSQLSPEIVESTSFSIRKFN
jgi:hypothetical protein